MSVKAHAQRRILKMAERAATLGHQDWLRVYGRRVHHEGLRIQRMADKIKEATASTS